MFTFAVLVSLSAVLSLCSWPVVTAETCTTYLVLESDFQSPPTSTFYSSVITSTGTVPCGPCELDVHVFLPYGFAPVSVRESLSWSFIVLIIYWEQQFRTTVTAAIGTSTSYVCSVVSSSTRIVNIFETDSLLPQTKQTQVDRSRPTVLEPSYEVLTKLTPHSRGSAGSKPIFSGTEVATSKPTSQQIYHLGSNKQSKIRSLQWKHLDIATNHSSQATVSPYLCVLMISLIVISGYGFQSNHS